MDEKLIEQFIASQGEVNASLQAMLGEISGVTLKQQGHTGTLLHGPGGMFNTPGLDEAIISTHVRSTGEIGRFRITTTTFEDGVLRVRFKLEAVGPKDSPAPRV